MTPTTWAIVDCEATGPDPNSDHAVEVGAALLHPDGEIELVVDTLLDPGVSIPATASAIHHLTDKDVSGAPVLADVHAQLDGLAEAYAAHTPALDAALLNLNSKLWACTYRLALHLWPEAPAHSNQVLRYWLNLDVTLPRGLYPHRAAADALVTAHLLRLELQTLAERHPEIHTPGQIRAFGASPAEQIYIPFHSRRGEKWADADPNFLEWVLDRDFSHDVMHTAQLWLDRKNDPEWGVETTVLDDEDAAPEIPF